MHNFIHSCNTQGLLWLYQLHADDHSGKLWLTNCLLSSFSLRSAQYQAVILEATAASTRQNQPKEPQQAEEAPATASDPQVPTEAPSALQPVGESPQQQQQEEEEEPAAQPGAGEEKPTNPSDVLMEEASPLEDAHAIQVVPEAPGSEPKPAEEPAAASTPPEEPPAPMPAPAPAPAGRTRKDKLTRLRELGLDPPPVPKLQPSDDAFVELEAPQVNPG